MLVYKEVTLMVTIRMLEGRGEGADDGEEIIVFLIWEGRHWTMGWRWESTKAESH